MAVCSLPLSASVGFELIDGIMYYIDTKTDVTYVAGKNGAQGNSPDNWYEGDLAIEPSVTFEGKTYKVKGTYSKAFSGCTKLNSVTFPNTVDSIGSLSFDYCSSLTSVNIPKGVRTIPYWSFRGCTSLREITIPASVVLIEGAAFEGCEFDNINIKSQKVFAQTGGHTFSQALAYTAIHQFTFGGDVLTIPTNVLDGYRNNGIAAHHVPDSYKVILKDNVATIEKHAFDNTVIESVELSKNLSTIGDSAFYGCSKLTDVSPLLNVITLGRGAFANCSKLKSIELNYVEEIKERTFYECASLGNVKIGIASVIADDAFYKCSAINYFTASAANPVYESQDGVLYNKDKTTLLKFPPSREKEYTFLSSVTSVTPKAFENYQSITSITSLKETPPALIEGDNLFAYVPGRNATVLVPEAVMNAYRIAWGTQNCDYRPLNSGQCTVDGITYEYHSDGTATVLSSAPKYSGDIIIPKTFRNAGGQAYTVTEIGMSAFYNCTELTSVSLPETLDKIGPSSFSGCTALTTITIPENVSSVSYSAFMRCSGLESLYFKPYRSVPSTGSKYFLSVPEDLLIYVPSVLLDEYKTRWSEMTNIQPEPIEYNGLYYIVDANNLNASVVQHPAGAGGYDPLVNIVVPEKINVYDGSFTVDAIGKNAFYGCEDIKTVALLNSIVSLDEYAFAYCKALTYIIIPENVESIGDWAFYNRTGLKYIICKATTPPVCGYYYCFGRVDKDIPLYVPYGSGEAYGSAPEWEDFNNITEYGVPTGIETVSGDQAPSVQKILLNGQILILRDGNVYTLTGKTVMAK